MDTTTRTMSPEMVLRNKRARIAQLALKRALKTMEESDTLELRQLENDVQRLSKELHPVEIKSYGF